MGPHFRAFGRRELNFSAIVTVDSEVPRSVRLVNISLGGACVEPWAELVPGSGLTLEVTTPMLWDPFVVRARVVWSALDGTGRPRAGLQFQPRRDGALRNLAELLGAERFE